MTTSVKTDNLTLLEFKEQYAFYCITEPWELLRVIGCAVQCRSKPVSLLVMRIYISSEVSEVVSSLRLLLI